MVDNTGNFKKVNFSYSLKNIPTSNKSEYIVLMYQKVYQLIERMRWKAFSSTKIKKEEQLNYQKESSIGKEKLLIQQNHTILKPSTRCIKKKKNLFFKKINDIEKNNRTLLDQHKALQKQIKKTNEKAKL